MLWKWPQTIQTNPVSATQEISTTEFASAGNNFFLLNWRARVSHPVHRKIPQQSSIKIVIRHDPARRRPAGCGRGSQRVDFHWLANCTWERLRSFLEADPVPRPSPDRPSRPIGGALLNAKEVTERCEVSGSRPGWNSSDPPASFSLVQPFLELLSVSESCSYA